MAVKTITLTAKWHAPGLKSKK